MSLRMSRIMLCLVFAALCAAQPASAARSFLAVDVIAPDRGNAPLVLRFFADEQACRKAYGASWQQGCPALPGEAGTPAEGVRLTPAPAGEWTWSSESELSFTPAKPWTPGTEIKIDNVRSVLPAGASLRAGALKMRTPPKAVRVASYTVFVDPGPAAGHVLTHSLHFLYPTDKDVTRGITVRPADPASGLRLAEPEFVWNHDDTELTVNTRILELSAKPAQVRLAVPGLPPYAVEEERNRVTAGKEAGGLFVVGGKEGLLRIENPAVERALNERMQQEFRLNMTSGLRIDPEQLRKQLRVVQLPRARTPEATRPFAWDRAPVVDEEDVAKGRVLTLAYAGEKKGVKNSLSFTLPAEPGSYVHVTLPAGIVSLSGLRLGKEQRAVLAVPKLKADLRFLQPGNVLPLNGEQKLSLYASEVESLKWEIAQVNPAVLALMLEQSSSFDDTWMSFDTVGPVARGAIPLPAREPGAPLFSVLDLAPLLQHDAETPRRGLLRIQISGMGKDRQGKEEQKVTVSRLVLATDLALVVKKGAAGEREVFVCSLSKGAPVAGAVIEVLGRNGLPLVNVTSDAAGRARLPSLKGLEREKEPTVVLARLGNDLAYLPLNDSSRIVEYGSLPTAGRRSSAEGMIAYVFSRGGIFRPGETLRFGCVARTPDWSPWPRGLPLTFVLWSPAGRKIAERIITPDEAGLAEFAEQTAESAQAGRYRLDVRLGGEDGLVLGSAAVRVEEFQPDTLHLAATFLSNDAPPPAQGWVSPDKLNAELELRNLYGLPAAGHRLRAEYEIAPALLRFPGYEDYVFYDAAPFTGEARSFSLPEVKSDAEGRARLNLPLDQVTAGTYRLILHAEGFEPGGGRAVGARSSLLVSTLHYALGFRTKQQLGYIPQHREATLDFIALAPDLRRHDPGSLNFVVSKRRFVAGLIRDKSGRYRYDATPVDTELSRQSLRLPARQDDPPLSFRLPTDQPGDFVLSVSDAEGRQLAATGFTVAGNALRLDGSLSPGKLTLRTSRQEYAPGERVELFISTPYAGAGLLTLEREGVVSHAWFRAESGDSVQHIDIPKNFEGKGYINLSFARSMHSDEIYMEPHLTAIAAIGVGVRQRDLGLALKAPESVRPGEEVRVSFSAEAPGRMILFAVDEGVLQLTRFPNPAPLDYFLLDRALEVQTLQALDLIMPDYARLQKRLSAFGGDAAGPGGRFQNPFRRKNEPPPHYWSGVVDVGPEERALSFRVPDYYNGTLRIMAVAADAGRVSAAHGATIVRAPLVITPQLPVLAAPGDVFEASAAFANTEGRELDLSLRMQTAENLIVEKSLPATARLKPGEELVLPLRFKAADSLGEASVLIEARTADAAAPIMRRTHLSIRPASPLLSDMQSGRFDASTVSTAVDVARTLYPYQAVNTASISVLPLPAVQGLVRRLNAYPYGCTEQRISRALPWAVLLSRPEFLGGSPKKPEELRKEARAVIDSAIASIRGRLGYAGVSSWQDGEADPLLTAYALDFLMAAREAGLAAGGGLEEQIQGCLERAAGTMPDTPARARAQAYAVWLLTRGGRITTPQLGILEEYMKNAPESRKDVTAALAAGAYRMLKLEDKARTLLRGLTPPPTSLIAGPPDQYPWDMQAAHALYITVLAKNFPERLRKSAGADPAAELIGNALLGLRRYFSTYAAAQSVRALAALIPPGQADMSGAALTCAQGAEGEKNELAAFMELSAPGCTRYSFTPPPGQPLYWQVFTQGFDRIPPAKAEAKGLEITRAYINEDGKETTQAALGEILTVHIDARSRERSVSDVVLLDLLPGGFEMVLPTVNAEGGEEPFPDAGAGSVPALKPDNTDRREDRMIVFATLTTEMKRFTYKIRAVNRGSFSLPPVTAEAIYAPALYARSAAGRMEVK